MTKTKQDAAVVPSAETAIAEQKLGVIAIEIRSIDSQTREYVGRSVIEIGKRLTEAKSLVAHGEWGKWLESNVPYSHSTAINFMRIASEYTDSQAIANLSYTQAVSLLALPAETREAFVEENKVDEMSSRELQAAIKAKQEVERQLQEEKKRVEAEQALVTQEQQQREALYEKYQEEMNLRKSQEAQVLQLQQDVEAAKSSGDSKAAAKLKTDLRKAEKTASESQQRIAELEASIEEQVKQRQAEIEQKAAESLQKREQELAEQAKKREEETDKQLAAMEEQLRKNNNTAAIQVKVHFESLLGTFQQLIGALKTLENEELKKGMQERIGQLCDQMKAQL